MKYFIGHLSFRLLCLALTIACFSLPVFSQKSEKAVQDTIKNKTSNEKAEFNLQMQQNSD